MDIQDGAKELTIASASSMIAAYTGVYWIFLIGLGLAVGLWAINRKQLQRRKLRREAKKEFIRWEKRVRRERAV